MKALLIEDSPELRDMFGAHLTTCGLTVDAFATGEEGRAALALSIYDILLLDLGLSDGDGLGLVMEVTAWPGLHLPIIVITGNGLRLHKL